MINQRNSARFLFTICAPLQALAFVSPSATLPPVVSSSVHLRDDGVGLSTFDERQGTASLRIFSPFDKMAVQHPPTRLFDNNGSVMESGEMILAKDNRLLDMAFSALDDKDKYETVLTGLCAKVIDGGEAAAKAGLVDPIRLMEEMNSSRIVAGQRGIISLIDVSLISLLSLRIEIYT